MLSETLMDLKIDQDCSYKKNNLGQCLLESLWRISEAYPSDDNGSVVPTPMFGNAKPDVASESSE